jgi:hypothetical protein
LYLKQGTDEDNVQVLFWIKYASCGGDTIFILYITSGADTDVGLTLTGVQRSEIRSLVRLISRPDRGCQPTDGCGFPSRYAQIKRGEGLGDEGLEFSEILSPLPHHSSTDH